MHSTFQNVCLPAKPAPYSSRKETYYSVKRDLNIEHFSEHVPSGVLRLGASLGEHDVNSSGMFWRKVSSNVSPAPSASPDK